MELTWRQTGTAYGYESYHYDFFKDGEKVGHASWDKNQANNRGLYVGCLEGVKMKNVYAATPEGIAHKLEKKLNELSTPSLKVD